MDRCYAEPGAKLSGILWSVRKVPFVSRLDAHVKLRVKNALPSWCLSRVRPNAIRTVRATSGRRHGTGIPVFALMCAWLEEDIVYAAVRNAVEQGVDRVFLLDNGSPDATIQEAEAAGATHVLTFKTQRFDEIFKYRLINEQIHHLSHQSTSDRIWWLMMDADEFVRAPDGRTLPEFVATLDARCRVVGARVLDHYPTPGLAYQARTDPLVVQPNCREKHDNRCLLGHHKHPLFLWDRRRKSIEVEPGFHQLRCRGEALFEPQESLIVHHFPYRRQEDTRRRLLMLMARGVTEATRRADADGHMRARVASLDAAYSGDYDEIIDYRTGRRGITVRDWREVLGHPK